VRTLKLHGSVATNPLPNPDELTSHLTKLQETQQVIGYPPVGEGICVFKLTLKGEELDKLAHMGAGRYPMRYSIGS
jgi:hypothetical protein